MEQVRGSVDSHITWNNFWGARHKYGKVKERLESFGPHKKIVILDCCWAGQAFNNDDGFSADPMSFINAKTETKTVNGGNDGAHVYGTFTAIAAPASEEAKDNHEDGKHSIYTGCLLQVISSGIKEKQTFLTTGELFQEVKSRINRDYSDRAPTPDSNQNGNIAELRFLQNQVYVDPETRIRKIVCSELASSFAKHPRAQVVNPYEKLFAKWAPLAVSLLALVIVITNAMFSKASTNTAEDSSAIDGMSDAEIQELYLSKELAKKSYLSIENSSKLLNADDAKAMYVIKDESNPVVRGNSTRITSLKEEQANFGLLKQQILLAESEIERRILDIIRRLPATSSRVHFRGELGDIDVLCECLDKENPRHNATMKLSKLLSDVCLSEIPKKIAYTKSANGSKVESENPVFRSIVITKQDSALNLIKKVLHGYCLYKNRNFTQASSMLHQAEKDAHEHRLGIVFNLLSMLEIDTFKQSVTSNEIDEAKAAFQRAMDHLETFRQYETSVNGQFRFYNNQASYGLEALYWSEKERVTALDLQKLFKITGEEERKLFFDCAQIVLDRLDKAESLELSTEAIVDGTKAEFYSVISSKGATPPPDNESIKSEAAKLNELTREELLNRSYKSFASWGYAAGLDFAIKSVSDSKDESSKRIVVMKDTIKSSYPALTNLIDSESRSQEVNDLLTTLLSKNSKESKD